jgi:D-alanyl-lipoteichoic acid acyltransferase DltB (MBOAT superfamily)
VIFTTPQFAAFFLIFFGLWFALPRRSRKWLLLVASYAFYGSWNARFLLLIAGSTLLDYYVGGAMHRTDDARRRTQLVTLSVVANLGALGFFKYYNFFVDSAVEGLTALGFDVSAPVLEVLLPVGISFYTFQTLAYTIDVYRHHLEPEKHFGRFALYVSYFPQLVAGPIERAGRLLPQLAARHEYVPERVVSGLRLMLWGMFKKVVVADRISALVDPVFSAPEQAGGFVIVLATTVVGLQIYYDFSAYSDIAIGAARVMGVKLMTNFDQPYLARSVNEFWARWHISLISWFRDYVYIPLGGSKRGKLLQFRNIMAIFVLSGLWHGAAWHFAIWGAVNGVFIIVGMITAPLREAIAQRTGFARWTRTRALWQWASAITIVTSGHVWFRAPDVPSALTMYANLGVGWGTLMEPGRWDAIFARYGMDASLFVATLLLIPIAELIEFRQRHLDAWKAPQWLTWVGDWLLIVGILWLGKFTKEAFVYFQF